jgi:hypothetical protein
MVLALVLALVLVLAMALVLALALVLGKLKTPATSTIFFKGR